nr:16S rRNA processing protein RimM [Zoogloeaceae bacterium]
MVVMGRIVAPFGIKGWVKVQPFADDALDWGDMP